MPELLLLKPKVFTDRRGYFFESWNKREFDLLTGAVEFVQDNESSSERGVMRGLHFQLPPYTQAKLVRCITGAVYDVAVDLRTDSPTYGQHFGAILSAENQHQLFIPKGFAHGFAVISDTAVFLYKCDNYYAPQADAGISLLDPSLGIEWPFSPETAILSPKDLTHPRLCDYQSPFTPEALQSCKLKQ